MCCPPVSTRGREFVSAKILAPRIWPCFHNFVHLSTRWPVPCVDITVLFHVNYSQPKHLS